MKTRVSAVAAALLLTATAFSGFNAWAISEQDYAHLYSTEVAPFFASGEDGTFQGVGGLSLRYRKFEARGGDEEGAIVIVNGRSETYLKYAETVYDLYQASGGRYSIYVYDHRGQGLSQRMLSDSQKGYVGEFDDYVRDLETFVSAVVNSRSHAKLFLISHSMGGAISTAYLMRHPHVFNAAVFSAPMLEINTGKFPEGIAFALASGACAVGKGEEYATGQSPYDPAKDNFATNGLTHSLLRYGTAKEIREQHPETILGGPTFRWIKEAMEADWKLVENGSRLVTPTLLMQAGADEIVRPGGQNRLCAEAARCVKAVFPTSGHEILGERDGIRNKAMARIISFFGLR